jgi:hypothetical protein
MISLFEKGLDKDDAKRREQYRDRLVEISKQPDARNTSALAVEAVPPISQRPITPMPSPPPQAQPAQAVAPATPAAVADLDETGHEAGDEFQKLAGQIAGQLAGAITVAVKQLHGVTAHDHEELEASLAAVSAVTNEMQALSKDLSTVRQQSESMLQADRTLSLKLATVDARLRDYEDNRQLTSKKLQSIEKRLDSQAAAIRSLHAGIREWAGRQEELRATLQKLVGASSSPPVEIQLPEEL